ncbi:MAG: 3'-5' exonuclease [Bacteroidales bacterium]|nr:3'-5' exonuclease [Bacteroidales bacterium]
MILSEIKPENVLYLDIETVPQCATYVELPAPMRELWNHKAATLIRSAEAETPESLYPRAGIYAEFGRIVCISVGMVVPKGERRTFRVKSFAGRDECQLLLDFALMLNQFGQRAGATLCGHNAKEFDFPFIARRMLINGVQLPLLLDIAGRKPWEVRLLDTMELWKFGDYKHYTSLRLLTQVFGIPSPKDDIDGSQVADCYYIDNDIERIAVYCEKDVLAVAQLLLRYKGLPLIDAADVERV